MRVVGGYGSVASVAGGWEHKRGDGVGSGGRLFSNTFFIAVMSNINKVEGLGMWCCVRSSN